MNQKYAKSFKLKFLPEADIRKSTIGDSNDFSLHWFFKNPWNWTILQRHSIKLAILQNKAKQLEQQFLDTFPVAFLMRAWDVIMTGLLWVVHTCSFGLHASHTDSHSRELHCWCSYSKQSTWDAFTPASLSLDEWVSRDFSALSKMMCFLFYLMTTISFFSFSEFQAVLSVECQYLACFAIFGAFSCVLHFKLVSNTAPRHQLLVRNKHSPSTM